MIVTTNKNLEAAIKERTFREDLMIHIQTPLLHEVPEIIRGGNLFLAASCTAAIQTELKEFSPVALECLTRYSWPGNTRELENDVKRLVASVRG